MTKIIANEQDFLDFLWCDTRQQVKKALYKGTDCGAWIEFEADRVLIGTIVEGSDAGFECNPLVYPFDSDDFEREMKELEENASLEWHRANFQCIICSEEIPEDAFDGMMEFYFDAAPVCSEACEEQFYKK